MSCQVKVEQGILQGKECKTYYGKNYYSFEGIPYAQPPVGKLRFRNPQPPKSWTGVRDATQPGNRCAQLNPYSSTPLEGSEDCLYLNVYTPSLPHEKIQKLPVIFFVHGGRLIFGYGDYYRPDYILRHDVILVTVNYRLNILGFLCLNLPEAPGNAGLKDTVMALKWVRSNISLFNGNTENITLFGESAGAAIVTSYLTSKMAEGLYNKVIAQSGNALADLYIIEGDDPIEKAKQVASILGKEMTEGASLYEFLVDVPINELIYAFSMAELSRHPSIIHAYFLPVIEKKFDGVERFFDEHPLVCVRENRYRKVPILTGINSHEAALFLRKDDQGNIIYETDFHYFIPLYLSIKQGSPKAKTFEQRLRSFYLQNKAITDTTKTEYLHMVSDFYFNKDIMYFCELFSKYSNELYLYKFNYSGSMNTRVMQSLGIKGSSHGDMIQYQFYRKSKADKCTEEDLIIVDFLSEAWCNFAKNGVPTWTNQKIQWLPYTSDSRHALLIDEEIKLVKDMDRERFKFWLDLLLQRCKL